MKRRIFFSESCRILHQNSIFCSIFAISDQYVFGTKISQATDTTVQTCSNVWSSNSSIIMNFVLATAL